MAKYHWSAFLFVPSFLLGMNGGFWQIRRRAEKTKKMADFDNLNNTPLESLPSLQEPAGEFQRIHLMGTFDNEGSMLVGPRPRPSHNNRIGGESQKGGFLVMTPFEVAHTKQFIMVNRGWVPIDACKSRLHLVQYIGEGFKPAEINGVIRKEERLGGWLGGDTAENHAPLPGAMAWQVARPYDMALYYFRRRFGPGELVSRQDKHGTRRYFVEMYEDMSGDDQMIVRGHAYPYRRETGDMTYVALTPLVHSMYSAFWFMVAFSSLYAMKRVFVAHRTQIIKEKVERKLSAEAQERMTKSGDAYKEEVRKVIEKKEGANLGKGLRNEDVKP